MNSVQPTAVNQVPFPHFPTFQTRPVPSTELGSSISSHHGQESDAKTWHATESDGLKVFTMHDDVFKTVIVSHDHESKTTFQHTSV